MVGLLTLYSRLYNDATRLIEMCLRRIIILNLLLLSVVCDPEG